VGRPDQGSEILVEYRDKLGIYNPLIERQQAKPVDARGGDDGSIGRILQRASDRRNFHCDFVRKRQNLEKWISLESFKELIQRNFQPQSSQACKKRYLKQAHGA
jgi:hypothetical protein